MYGNGDVYDYRATGIRFTSIDYGFDQLFWTDGRDNGNGNGRHGELYVIGHFAQPHINSSYSNACVYGATCGHIYNNSNRFKRMYRCADGSVNTANFINVKCDHDRYFV